MPYESNPFYQSLLWKNCRKSFVSFRRSIDGGMCQRCGENPGYIVHHKVHLNAVNVNDPGIALSFDNLEYLCMNCHNAEHFSKGIELACGFDSSGRPIKKEGRP